LEFQGGDDDAIERRVDLTVAATVDAVTVGAAADRDRGEDVASYGFVPGGCGAQTGGAVLELTS
jgi:hypothetical protein